MAGSHSSAHQSRAAGTHFRKGSLQSRGDPRSLETRHGVGQRRIPEGLAVESEGCEFARESGCKPRRSGERRSQKTDRKGSAVESKERGSSLQSRIVAAQRPRTKERSCVV